MINGDTAIESDETIVISASLDSYSATASKAITVTNDDVAPPTGFIKSSATNSTWKSAVAAARAGTGSANVVVKGDSTGVDQGGGDQGSANGFANSRVGRPAARIATSLSASGTPAFDKAVYGDNGASILTDLTQYDPRVTGIQAGGRSATKWGTNGNMDVAGGALLLASTAPLTLTETNIDSFEIVIYDWEVDTIQIRIDGAVPETGPSSISSTSGGPSGFVKATVKAASVGTHTLTLTGTNSVGKLRSIKPFNSTTPTLNFLVHASLGAASVSQAGEGYGISNNDALAYDAPALTIINLGLNDNNANVAVATYINNLQAIITKAKLSGDVLLMYPHPAGGGFQQNADTYLPQVKALAASNNVDFLSLYEYFGSSFTPALQARMFDGIVHPKPEMYAEISAVMKQCLDLMAAA